ncbi:MAG: hypothetical protein KA797_05760 [Chitinophagales bacterium]|nr:hypothetical protein [Chitinophagales bacterium]
MNANSTQEKLLLLAYHELSEEESLEVQTLIVSDDNLRRAWFQIQEVKNELDLQKIEPSRELIHSILEQIAPLTKKAT